MTMFDYMVLTRARGRHNTWWTTITHPVGDGGSWVILRMIRTA